MAGETRNVGARRVVKSLDVSFEAGLQWLALVAVGKYRHCHPLANPVRDAKKLREVLERRYCVDRVEALYDEDATKRGILELLKKLQAEAGTHDSVLVYYAGHGKLDESSNLGFWIPCDGGSDLVDQANWLPNAQVRGMVRGMRARHVCVVADACFSGDLLDAGRRPGVGEMAGEEYFRKAYGLVSRQALTSGSSEEVPDDSEFAMQLLLELEGNTRKCVDPLALYEKMRLGMRRTTPLLGEFKECGHQAGGSFLLFLKDDAAQPPVAQPSKVATGKAEEVARPPKVAAGVAALEGGPTGGPTLADCPLCGDLKKPEETFNCPGACGKKGLCREHKVKVGPGRWLCEACALAERRRSLADAVRRGVEDDVREALAELEAGLGAGARKDPGLSEARKWLESLEKGREVERQRAAREAAERAEQQAARKAKEEAERRAEVERQRAAQEKAAAERAERDRLEAEQRRKEREEASRKAGEVWRDPATGLELVWVPPGSFTMGSPDTEVDRSSVEGPQHRVTIARGFWMGKYEVTQGQWESVMGSNPSSFKDVGKGAPVENVSWDDCQEYIRKLNEKSGEGIYRLPSEAEWEYACRAGTATAFSYGDSLSSAQANFAGNYPYGGAAKGAYLQKTTPVGSFKPNAWGLYDMHGNVWEWCEDAWHDSYQGAPADGGAWVTGGDATNRLLRGGSWSNVGHGCRSARRNCIDRGLRGLSLGCRLVYVSRT